VSCAFFVRRHNLAGTLVAAVVVVVVVVAVVAVADDAVAVAVAVVYYYYQRSVYQPAEASPSCFPNPNP
jgi:hypothetical protein